MAEDRSIRVRFQAEFGDLAKQLDDAAKKSDNLGQKIEASSKKVEAARSQQRAAANQVAAAEKHLNSVMEKSNSTAAQRTSASKRVQQAKDAERAATEKLTAAEKLHSDIANRATTNTGRLAQSAQENSAQWNQAGAVLLSAGAAITGLGTAALVAGVNYNSLQQKSRAAMTTLLGSAEAANEQMDKLDTFAKTSPFSKQTFITAQQQMLAFGIETSKVIPYLDALNDATAAAGGNGQQLGELAFIMAQISAAGKITGQDLIQFGQRGVNAAELIGSQMGKTGAEIRGEITAGTLNANAALDALAAGMKQTYDGAASNVKMTWEGALDRVKSAWRDLGSELAEPLVGKEGGGILVRLANQAADAVRGFLALPEPIKIAAAAVVGLAGGTLLLAGAYLTLGPRVVSTTAALKAQHVQMITLSKSYRGLTAAAKLAGRAMSVIASIAIADGISNWIDNVGQRSTEVETMAIALGQYSKGVKSAADVDKLLAGDQGFGGWLSGADGIKSVTDALTTYNRVVDDSGKIGARYSNSLLNHVSFADKTKAEVDQAKQGIEALDSALAQMASSGDAETIAAAQDYYAKKLAEANISAERGAQLLPQYAAATTRSAEETQKAVDAEVKANEDRARSMGYVGQMSEETQKYLQAWRDSAMEANASFISGSDAYADALSMLEDAERERAETAAKESGKTGASWEDFYNEVSVSAKDYIQQLEDQVAAQENWEDNMLTLTKRVNEGMTGEMKAAGNAMIDELMALGPEGADQVALLESMSKKQFDKVVKLWSEKGTSAVTEFTSTVEQYRQPVLDVDVDLDAAYRKVSAFIRDQSGRKILISVDNRGNSEVRTGARNQVAKAAGGAISGPGTATSDSIPAMLSNGEHVLTASDVTKLGGQGAVYRMRGLAQSGMLKFATGGAVSTAKANRDSAKAEAKAVERAQKRAQERYSDIGSGKDNKAAKSAAKKALDAAKEAKKKADKALKRAESALEDARQRAQYRSDFLQDRRRGDTVQSAVREGNGLSAVDDLLGMANSGAFGKLGSKMLRDAAAQSEKKILALNKALESATDSFDKLSALYDDVRGGLSSGFSFDALLGQTDSLGFAVGGSGNDLAAGASAYAGKISTLGTKIVALRKAGATQALIEQIARMPLDTAIQVADAFLSDPGSASAASSALSAIDKNANAVGLAVAQGAAGAGAAKLYIGAGGDLGSAAVDALLKNADAIGSNIATAILGATSTKATTKKATKKAKKKALGGPVSAGQPYLVGEEGPELFWPGASGAIIPSRLTIPAVQASSSGTSVTYQGPTAAEIGSAVAAAVSTLPVELRMEAGTKFASELTRIGAHENARSGNQDWKISTGQAR
ncbi:hypothetical protein GCM10010401_07450 [Rarobacter faecitabidus]|uniref:tape measure protein n=1 Tax=Rarobacter faecitabidus TaxID=13243 RepID=UPI0031D182D9